ncbi:uncharacterized protein [Dysidea avara]|uniref:uncharacterized protein isoform X3 n=1 Tax=Dysidea avara TaxID=196820 RepID=UPI00332B1AD3
MDDGEDYSTDLLLASLLDDSIDDDDDSTSQQTPDHSSSALVGGPVKQYSVTHTTSKQVTDNKTTLAFDSLEDLLNATLSPSEGSTSDVGRSSTSSLDAGTTGETSRKPSASLPPKFRNTFKPVEASETASTAGLDYSVSTSPSFVVASQSLPVSSITNRTNDNGNWYLKNNASTSNSSWNDPLYPPSKRARSEGCTTSKESLPVNSSTSYSTYSGVPSLLGRSGAVTTANTTVPIMAHQATVTTTSLNGVLSSSISNTTATLTNAAALKRLQETNLISDLQAASAKPISSASILHAIQVVQLNYGMLLQKLSQNIDDATAQEVKTKLMVLTHHYKQLSQQYQAKLTAEKLSSTTTPATTSSTNTLTKMSAALSSLVTSSSFAVSSHMSQPAVSSVTTTSTTCLPSNVIDLTHDKSVRTTASTGKDTNVLSAAVTAGANYLQSIPSLAAYLLQNTEAQKQLTPVELQQLNQIRVNLLQEFQRRQVQNFLTSLPADIRPKNVTELKDMMKEKNFSIQIPPFLVTPVVRTTTPQYKPEIKSDPLATAVAAAAAASSITDNKQLMGSGQQSVMATLLPHSMVTSGVKSEQLTSFQRDNHLPSLSLPVDVKPVSGQMCIGDMLQQLQANQPLGIGKLPALSLPSLLKGDSSFTKRDDFSTATGGGGSMQSSRSNMYARSYTTSSPQYNRTKYRAMAASASPATSTIAPQLQQSVAGTGGVMHSMASSSLSQRSLYNTRAQLRTQRLIEEQKRLEEERIKQLQYTPEQLKTISNIKYFMQADHSRITKVDTQTPFHSKQDAFQRLAAYHVYYEPEPSEAIENRVEQMHDILARELMKKSRGLTAKYHHLLLKDMETPVPKHIDLANERLFVEAEMFKDSQSHLQDCTPGAISLDGANTSKLPGLNSSQLLLRDINILQYTNTSGSVGIT